MAVRPPYKAEEPQWFDVEAWGAQAEVIANYVRKGTGLAVKGELVFDHWVDKNTGAPRSKAFIRVKLLELLGSPRERQESGAATSEFPTPDLVTIANEVSLMVLAARAAVKEARGEETGLPKPDPSKPANPKTGATSG